MNKVFTKDSSPYQIQDILNELKGRSEADQRALCCLLGSYAGDNLGNYMEFTKSIAQHQLYEALQMNGKGVHHLLPGQSTDDTELATSLGYGLIESGRQGVINLNMISKYYGVWMSSPPFDQGMTIRNALQPLSSYNLKAEAEYSEYMYEDFALKIKSSSFKNNTGSLSNGGLMRIAPLIVYLSKLSDQNQIKEAVYEEQSLTHPHETAQEVAYIFVRACISLIQIGKASTTFSDIENYIKYECKIEMIKEYWQKHVTTCQYTNAIEKEGFVFHAFTQAFILLNYLKQIEDQQKTFDRKNIYVQFIKEILKQCGDSDTNAAICGALLGSYLLIREFPEDYVNKIISCDLQNKNQQLLAHPRIPLYNPRNCIYLCKELLSLAPTLLSDFKIYPSITEEQKLKYIPQLEKRARSVSNYSQHAAQQTKSNIGNGINFYQQNLNNEQNYQNQTQNQSSYIAANIQQQQLLPRPSPLSQNNKMEIENQQYLLKQNGSFNEQNKKAKEQQMEQEYYQEQLQYLQNKEQSQSKLVENNSSHIRPSIQQHPQQNNNFDEITTKQPNSKYSYTVQQLPSQEQQNSSNTSNSFINKTNTQQNKNQNNEKLNQGQDPSSQYKQSNYMSQIKSTTTQEIQINSKFDGKKGMQNQQQNVPSNNHQVNVNLNNNDINLNNNKKSTQYDTSFGMSKSSHNSYKNPTQQIIDQTGSFGQQQQQLQQQNNESQFNDYGSKYQAQAQINMTKSSIRPQTNSNSATQELYQNQSNNNQRPQSDYLALHTPIPNQSKPPSYQQQQNYLKGQNQAQNVIGFSPHVDKSSLKSTHSTHSNNSNQQPQVKGYPNNYNFTIQNNNRSSSTYPTNNKQTSNTVKYPQYDFKSKQQ